MGRQVRMRWWNEGGFMLEAWSRRGRLLSLGLLLMVVVEVTSASTPATTRITDTVYRADGAPAGGTLLISWPAFTTADNSPVAAGNKSVQLGPQGALSVDLVPNAGAIPTGTLYKVIYKLDDGTTATEFWSVGASSPTTIASVRTTPGSGTASAIVSRQYVDTIVAGKANDAAVVHLAGNEIIEGSKQFSAPPSVPTPLLAAEAANKAYVDSAVTAVGSGSYVSKAGDTMSGPLTLAGDPLAPNQAASRHYVDNALSSKADLVSGIVPNSQLGAGAPDASKCLKGDGTWGACGTSSNAISIQGIAVSATAPTEGQVPTYEAATGMYKPKAGGSGGGSGLTAGMQAIKYATDFAWSASATGDLSAPGAKTVTLNACPAGVSGGEPDYWVYLSGTGTAEAARIIGGTCAGNGAAGTLQFTTANSHPAGYTIGSASGGLQEALIAARFMPTNPNGESQSGKVIVPPGELNVYARVTIRASSQTVDFSGSILNCYMDDTCIFVGSSNANDYGNITLISPRGRPMIVNGIKPFVEVNASRTRVFNVTTRTSTTGGTFGSFIQVDDDQAFLLDGLDTVGTERTLRCDATYCGAYVTAPGPYNVWSAVGWLKHLNISAQCKGNGIDWQSGNTLHVQDSVIQGQAQYAIRSGVARGGYGGTEIDDLYTEAGSSCTNPSGNIGFAGIIQQGNSISIGGVPSGLFPTYKTGGSNDYRYYVVARSGGYVSIPIYAGHAMSTGSDTITVTTPDIAAADSFDLLRTTYVNGVEVAPYGTGNYLVSGNVSRGSACTNGVCTFTDTNASLGSYAVTGPTYIPKLDFWPGGLVLSGTGTNNIYAAATATMESANSGAGIIALQGTRRVAVTAKSCGSSSSWTGAWVSCYTMTDPPEAAADQAAMVMALKPVNDGGLRLNLKGRINFSTLGSGPGHIITLSDSNFGKTIATANHRPTNDANDAYIGYDRGDGTPNLYGISFGAPLSLSNYIGNVGDGTNWKERLTASLKEFKTDVKINGNLQITGTCTGCGGGGGNNVVGDLTVTGSVIANSFQSTGTGPWNVEGGFGTITAAAANKSKVGFGPSGKLSVSENAGAVTEVAKKLPQEFTYTFFDSNNLLTTALQVPSVYVNRAAALHIIEVYCEIDAGTATINVQKDNGTTKTNILSSALACSTAGATSTGFTSGNDAIGVGQKVGHVTVSASGALHRMNVVVKYLVD
jgi:hypothetical protein